MAVTRLSTLLWLDCSAGGVVGIAMLALSSLLAPRFGLPRAVLLFTAFANLAYGAFSFSLARTPSPPPRRVRLLVAANVSWTVVCIALAVAFGRPATLGAAYLLLEGAIVGTLGLVEWRALRR